MEVLKNKGNNATDCGCNQVIIETWLTSNGGGGGVSMESEFADPGFPF